MPVLDLTDPCEIPCYFDDLEFLFLKHHISDAQEKKRAAVNYLSMAVEQLWKTAHTFGDPTRSYEDFKVEVIMLYPEVIAAQEYSLTDFDRLVANHARTPIHSEIELGAYYRDFLIISHFLICHVYTPRYPYHAADTRRTTRRPRRPRYGRRHA